jgi:hypothetical protein
MILGEIVKIAVKGEWVNSIAEKGVMKDGVVLGAKVKL